MGFFLHVFFLVWGLIRFIISRGLLEWLYNTVSDYVVLFCVFMLDSNKKVRVDLLLFDCF